MANGKGKGKARDSVRSITPVPNWMIDEVFPLLTSDEVKVLQYVIRRTWGIGVRRARISISQISEGVQWEGEWIDRGTSISTRRITTAIEGMRKYGAIVRTAEHSKAKNLPPEYKPGWRNVVDVRGLKERYLEKMKKDLRVAGNWGGEIGVEARLPEHIASIPDVARSHSYQQFVRDYIDDGYEVEPDFDITVDDADDDVDESGMGQTVMNQTIKDRVARFTIPPAVTAAGVTAEEFVAMKNFLLDLTGLRATADSNVVPYADQALGAATETAALAVVCGLTSVVALDGLPAFWHNNWRYADAVKKDRPTMPTFRQLCEPDVLPAYATQKLAPPPAPLRVYQTARPDEDGFVSSELDDWQP